MNKNKNTKSKTEEAEEAKEPTVTFTGRLDPNRLQATFEHVELWLLENDLADRADADETK